MLNEEELRRALATICTAVSWVWVRTEGNAQVWRCASCGRVTKDTQTISGSLLYGPHYKPGCEPARIPQAFYDAFTDQE